MASEHGLGLHYLAINLPVGGRFRIDAHDGGGCWTRGSVSQGYVPGQIDLIAGDLMARMRYPQSLAFDDGLRAEVRAGIAALFRWVPCGWSLTVWIRPDACADLEIDLLAPGRLARRRLTSLGLSIVAEGASCTTVLDAMRHELEATDG